MANNSAIIKFNFQNLLFLILVLEIQLIYKVKFTYFIDMPFVFKWLEMFTKLI